MPRKMSPEREREYAELAAYLDFFMTHVEGVDPGSPVHPTNVMKTIEAQHGKSRALEGLRQAINDTAESTSDMRPERVAQLDAALRDKGIITLSEIRRRHAATYKRILRRATIRTETDYHLIAGILADVSSAMPDKERALLQQMAEQFEDQTARGERT